MSVDQIEEYLEGGETPKEALSASYSELEEYAEEKGMVEEYRDLLRKSEIDQDESDIRVSWSEAEDSLADDSGKLSSFYSTLNKKAGIGGSLAGGTIGTLAGLATGPLAPAFGSILGGGLGYLSGYSTGEVWNDYNLPSEEELDDYSITIEPENHDEDEDS